MTRTRKRFIGDIGEEIATRFLVKHGYSVVERNYLKKWGEIDVIARKGGILHFVEVKTLQTTSFGGPTAKWEGVVMRPEESVHPGKLKRLHRAIETYLLDRDVSPETNWQIDVISVLLNLKDKQAKIKILGNIIA